jgi:hypothetical protein
LLAEFVAGRPIVGDRGPIIAAAGEHGGERQGYSQPELPPGSDKIQHAQSVPSSLAPRNSPMMALGLRQPA